MSKLLSIACALLIAVLPACSVPDGDSMEGLMSSIGRLGPSASFEARRAEARARAIADLERMDQSDVLGDADCRDMHGGVRHPIAVRDVLECLNSSPIHTMYQCIDDLVDKISAKYMSQGTLNPGARCGYSWRGKVEPNPKWDMSEITDDDLARSALASSSAPPAWMFAAGIVAIGVGGVFIFASGWGAILCPLSVDYGCPGDPLAPGDSPEPGGTTGGDQ
jgi:hypothetical protein